MNLEKAKSVYFLILRYMKKKFTGPLWLRIDFNQGGITDVHKVNMDSEKIEV